MRLAAVLACALLLGGPGAVPRRAEIEKEEAGPYPSDWFGAQRSFPGDVIPQESWQAALEWARVERSAQPLTTSSLTPMVWQPAGPFNIGGRVTALAVAPGGATLYLGAAAGGVFKSVNSGLNWSPVFDQVTSIGALALEPGNPSVIYAGTGEANAAVDNYDGAGLYRSSNGGQGWTYLGLQETRRIGRVAVDPSNPARIFVAAMGAQYSTGPDRGLYRSENGGQSWSKVLFVNDSTGVCDVVINPAHPETVFCASWERIRRTTYRRVYGPGCGIWRSVDHGTTWTRLANGLPAPSDNVGRIGLAIAPSWPARIYAQIMAGNPGGLNGLGVYRSDDGGGSWARRDTDQSGFVGAFGGFGWYFGDIVVDPSSADRVYCLGANLVVSNNAGASFSSFMSGAHADEHALWIDPANPLHLYMGSDGGFFYYSTSDLAWDKSLDLPITQFYAGAIDPSNPARLLGGTQDNFTPITSGSPTAWTSFYDQGDGFYCLIDPTNPLVGFAEYQFGSNGFGPLRTANGGGSWVAGTGISDGASRFNWCAPFVMDPSNHLTLLAGGYRVWRSINSGLNWTLISADLTRNIPSSLPYTSVLSTLDISPLSSNLYYVGTTDGKVWRSTNAGGVWTDITAGLPVRWVTRVTADPVDPNVVYVTLSGYGLDEQAAHVYRSTNQGTNWTAIDGNLPDVPVNDLVVDPLNPSRLFIATDTGVYYTSNLGVTWAALGIGHPLVPVFDLTLHNASRTLVSATHGRSQWKLDLNDLPVAVVPGPAPSRLSLSDPVPNPSRGELRLDLETDTAGAARVEVFDPQGRRVIELLDHRLEPGRHRLAWDGRDARGARVPAGIYYLRADLAGRASLTRRVVRLD
jgi:photosystem II stability/assembly factor-like uncharacterized protein